MDRHADSINLDVANRLNIPGIVEAYRTRLSAFIRNRVNRAESAEDILQDVFYQLVEADRMMKPIEQVTSWLFTVARNLITDYYRKKKPQFLSDLIFEDEYDDAIGELGELLSDDRNNPEAEYIASLVMEEIRDALEDLPSEQREVFEQTEFEGRTYKDIAELTGKPVNTLISRKRYAVLYLRERLRILYDELINF